MPVLVRVQSGEPSAKAVLTRVDTVVRAAFFKPWRKARAGAGRPDLRFHDLRHTGAVLAAQEGATLAELQARLGHTTPAAAMIYQHAASEPDKLLAERLSRRATGAESQA